MILILSLISWTVYADEGNIQQDIMNIVVNARDALPGGGRIAIKTENLDLRSLPADLDLPSGKGICLTISDSGTGMGQKTVRKIFEPFFTTKEAGYGTGLGLSVAYGIVKQHQGDIQVESEPGQGSSFRIYLPAGSGKLPVPKEDMALSVEELQGSGERILLVEDEESVRNFGLRVLRDHGYVVFDTANAREAIDVFEAEEGNIQMIFSDVVLPDLTGLELIEHLLSRKPSLLVLLSSGYTDKKLQWPLIQEKGYRFLQKPYSMADLLTTIKSVLNRSTSPRSAPAGRPRSGQWY
ncbi:MAG: ATP-binding protein [bacterium]